MKGEKKSRIGRQENIDPVLKTCQSHTIEHSVI